MSAVSGYQGFGEMQLWIICQRHNRPRILSLSCLRLAKSLTQYPGSVVPPAMFCLFNAVPDDNFARTQLPILLVRKWPGPGWWGPTARGNTSYLSVSLQQRVLTLCPKTLMGESENKFTSLETVTNWPTQQCGVTSKAKNQVLNLQLELLSVCEIRQFDKTLAVHGGKISESVIKYRLCTGVKYQLCVWV